MTPRAVFDCMLFLQGAARETSLAAACFRLLEQGTVMLCLSPEILAEVKDVLNRPGLQKKFKKLTPEWADRFLREAEDKAVSFPVVPVVFPYPRDPKDEPYLNLALAAGARYLVSWDHDLLDLMHDASFRQQFPDLKILDPVAFVRDLTGQPLS